MIFLNILGPMPKAVSEDPVAEAPAEEVPEKAAQEPPVPDKSTSPVASPPFTPPPRVRTMSDLSEAKHSLYKSRRCGSFCRDCRLTSFDLDWFKTKDCIPQEFKAEVGENETVDSPAEGERESILEQVKEAQALQEKLQLLQGLREEEERLDKLLRMKVLKSEQDVGGEKPLEPIETKFPAQPPVRNIDNLETLPLDPTVADINNLETLPLEDPGTIKKISPEEKLKQEALVLEDYARDMEGYENQKMKRHDKDFIEPLCRNFKCLRVTSVVANPAANESNRTKGDNHESKSLSEQLAELCSQFHHSADGASDVKAADLIQSLKRSLDEMLADATPSEKVLADSSKNRRIESQVKPAVDKEHVEDKEGKAADDEEPMKEPSRSEGENDENEEDEENEENEEDEEDDDEEEDSKPTAVERTNSVSPKDQIKMTAARTSKKKKVEEDEEDEEPEEGEDDHDDDDGDEKPSGSDGPKKGRGRKAVKPKAKAKAKGRAKAKAKAKAKSRSKKVTAASKKATAASKKATPKAKATAKAKVKATPTTTEVCPFCADKKKLRSFQCCAYKHAKVAAQKKGKSLEEATKIAKAVSYLNS